MKLRVRRAYFLVLSLLVVASAVARDWQAGLDLAYTNGPYMMPYRLYLPADYSETNSYPVVIFLHGSGERGSNNTSQVWSHIAGLIDRTESNYPSILIASQLPATVDEWYVYPDLTMEIVWQAILLALV